MNQVDNIALIPSPTHLPRQLGEILEAQLKELVGECFQAKFL